MEEEEKAQREAAGNAGREGRTKVAVAVEILRRREPSTRLVIRKNEDGNLRVDEAKAER